YVTDEQGRRSPDAALQAGAGGSLLVLAVAVTGVGVWNLIVGRDDTAVWLFVAAAVILGIVLFSPSLTEGAARFIAVLRAPDWYRRYYMMIAAFMLIVGVVVYLAPIDWDHRTLYLELLELVPFGVFWLVQTVENWNQPVEHFDYRSAPSTPYARG
ncbi:MAG: hypothetical protein OER95_13330, partial [Acidimicrobiia bacterium]|nr:hypothetical protein [Acidimicrobiia bacterium]